MIQRNKLGVTLNERQTKTVQSLASLTTLSIFLLWATTCTADPGGLNSQRDAGSPVLQSTSVSPASEGAPLLLTAAPTTDSTKTKTGSWLSEVLQTLSPLPVLALGILGLFWVRRHTAEL